MHVFQTIHCPSGITEKDLLTFFSTTCPDPSEEETRKALVLFRRHDRRQSWKDATLWIACPWGTVQFIAGRGSDVVSVNIDGQELVRKRGFLVLFLNMDLFFPESAARVHVSQP